METKKKFLNLSNHPSDCWNREQREAALSLGGEIADLPFPAVPADADELTVEHMADVLFDAVKAEDPAAVLCQGEFTLCHAVISRLLQAGIPVYAACSERRVREIEEDGHKVKRTEFSFCRMRAYG